MRTPARILIADDNPDNLDIFRTRLAVHNYEIVTATDGEEALLRAREKQPDLILLDVMMPEMDGPTTLWALRDIEAIASTPVIFVTAKAQPIEVKSYRDLGAVEVFTKPFQPMRLPDQLRELWRRIQQ